MNSHHGPLFFVAALALGGCLEKSGGDSDTSASSGTTGNSTTSNTTTGNTTTGNTTTGNTTGGGGEGFGPEDVSLSLTSGGVSVSIVEAPSGGFDFGINENCGDPGNCWEAESCLTDTAGWAFCHDAGTQGVSLSKVSHPDSVISSSTTLFNDSFDGKLGYMLDTGTTCYAWGDFKSYFVDAVGCTAW